MNLNSTRSHALDLRHASMRAAEPSERFAQGLQDAMEELSPRNVAPEDWLRFQDSVAEILTAFGMDLDGPATERTPERLLTALYDATRGYDGDHKLLTTFPT